MRTTHDIFTIIGFIPQGVAPGIRFVGENDKGERRLFCLLVNVHKITNEISLDVMPAPEEVGYAGEESERQRWEEGPSQGSENTLPEGAPGSQGSGNQVEPGQTR